MVYWHAPSPFKFPVGDWRLFLICDKLQRDKIKKRSDGQTWRQKRMMKRALVTVDFCHQDNVVTWDSIDTTRQYNQIRCKDLCTPKIKVDRGYAANNEKLESHNVIQLHLDPLSNSTITQWIYATKEFKQRASAFVINFITQHLPWNVKLVTFGLKAAELDHLGAKAKSILLFPVLFFF